MTEPRLASSIRVSALLKRAEAEGGFGAVLAKGDPTSGSIAILLTERGKRAMFLERLLRPDGRYFWQASRQSHENEEEFQEFLRKRRRIDPDLWIVELDIASAERFAAGMNCFD